MIQNYFKIAWRNLNKHRFYAAINILGLPVIRETNDSRFFLKHICQE